MGWLSGDYDANGQPNRLTSTLRLFSLPTPRTQIPGTMTKMNLEVPVLDRALALVVERAMAMTMLTRTLPCREGALA